MQNLREIKGKFSLDNSLKKVQEPFWDRNLQKASKEYYQKHIKGVWDRFLKIGDEEESRARLDQTLTMATDLFGYAALNVLRNSKYSEHDIIKALFLYTATGYFLDDDNDQAVQDPKVMRKKAAAFLKMIEEIFSEAIAQPEVTMEKYKRDLDSNPKNKGLVITSAAADMMAIIRLNSNPESSESAERFKKLLSEHWTASFTTSKDYIPDTVEEYIELRRLTSGMLPTIELISFILGIELSDELYNRFPELKEAILAIADFGGLLNDILSAPKEILDEKARFNLVKVIEVREGVSITRAFERAFEIVNECFDKYQNAMTRLLGRKDLSEEEAQIVHALKLALDQIAWASDEWQRSTERYRHEFHPVNEFVREKV